MVVPIRVEGLDGSQAPDDISILPVVACAQPSGVECYGVGHTKYLTVVRSDFMITFDDGPFKHAHGAPMNTPANATQTILDQLADVWVDGHPVRAAFFVVGHNGSMRALLDPVYMREGVDGEPDFNPSNHDLAQAIAGAGHLLGNHTNTHNHFPLSTQGEVLGEIIECNNKLGEAGLNDSGLFRLPYFGFWALDTDAVVAHARTIRSIVWGSVYRDWTDVSAGQVKGWIIQDMTTWNIPSDPVARTWPNIVVLHDCGAPTPANVKWIVDGVRAEGFVLVDCEAPSQERTRNDYYWDRW